MFLPNHRAGGVDVTGEVSSTSTKAADGSARPTSVRCKALVIPPAWRDVWICPLPNGHLQAVGTDDAGRRQYLYHPEWREQRDRAKHDRVLDVGDATAAGPCSGDQVCWRSRGCLGSERWPPRFGCSTSACSGSAVRSYAEDNGSYGLATIEKRHVRVRGTRSSSPTGRSQDSSRK